MIGQDSTGGFPASQNEMAAETCGCFLRSEHVWPNTSDVEGNVSGRNPCRVDSGLVEVVILILEAEQSTKRIMKSLGGKAFFHLHFVCIYCSTKTLATNYLQVSGQEVRKDQDLNLRTCFF